MACKYAEQSGCICAKCEKFNPGDDCCVFHENLYCRSRPGQEPPDFLKNKGFTTNCPDFVPKEDD